MMTFGQELTMIFKEQAARTAVLLDKVRIEGEKIIAEPLSSFEWDKEDSDYKYKWADYVIRISADLNTAAVIVRVSKENNVVAEFIHDISGHSQERYANVGNREFKMMLAEWFEAVSAFGYNDLDADKHFAEPVDVIEADTPATDVYEVNVSDEENTEA